MKTNLNPAAPTQELSESATIFLGLAIFFYTFITSLNLLFLSFANEALGSETGIQLDITALFKLWAFGGIAAAVLAYSWLDRIAWQWIALGASLLLIVCQVLASIVSTETLLLVGYFLQGLAAGTLAVLCFASAGLSQQKVRLFACAILGALLAHIFFMISAYLFAVIFNFRISSWIVTALTFFSLPLMLAFPKTQQALPNLPANPSKFSQGLMLGIIVMFTLSLATSLSNYTANLSLFSLKADSQLRWINWALIFSELAKVLTVTSVLILGNSLQSRLVIGISYGLLMICSLALASLNLLDINSIGFFVIFAILIQCTILFLEPVISSSIASLQASATFVNTLYLAGLIGLMLSSFLRDWLHGHDLAILITIMIFLGVSLLAYLFSQTSAQHNKD
ncbi:MAG TPA: hypothetical protein PLM98_04505 [Thiolinea sp.]|nr:hypothetical protein [Thiolinea sp.]